MKILLLAVSLLFVGCTTCPKVPLCPDCPEIEPCPSWGRLPTDSYVYCIDGSRAVKVQYPDGDILIDQWVYLRGSDGKKVKCEKGDE